MRFFESYALAKLGGQNETILPDFCPWVFGFAIGVWNQVHFHSFGAV